MRALIVTLGLLLAACGTPEAEPASGAGGGSGGTGTGTGSNSGGSTGSTTSSSSTSTGEPTDPHPLGMDIPPFALEDLNPSSPTYGLLVDSADLAGAPYALVFLDSRCTACPDVADALWQAYQDHPTWWDAQPTFAVERAKALEVAPESVALVVEGNALPYLADTNEIDLWLNLGMLNHDFIAVSAEGTLEVWLPMYDWPADLAMFLDHMTGRYGP